MNNFLIVSPYPPPYWGGHMVYLSTLVEHCALSFDILTNALPEGQNEIIVQKDRPLRKRWIRSMFGMPSFTQKVLTYPYILAWLFWKRFTKNYDAVIVNWAPAPNALVHILGWIMRFKTIGLMHGEEITLTLRGKGFKSIIKRFLMKFGYKRANGFIASCHFIRDQAVTHLKINRNIIDVIPVCFNPKNIVPSGIKKNRGYDILSVGTLVERKGFHLLLDAVYALKDELPQIRLHIVGNGPFLTVINERIKRYGLQERVILHGNLYEEQLSKVFEISDLFVLASQMLEDGNTEGASLVVCDASAHGLPVIGGTGGGLTTTIIDGETGFIVESRNIVNLANKIRYIFTHPDKAQKMGMAGVLKVKRDHDPARGGRLLEQSIHRLILKTLPSREQIQINTLFDNPKNLN